MKASTNPSPKGKSSSQQIDAIIKQPGDWRGKKLSELRAVIKKADPAVIEEVKWKKPSNSMGVPVWSHDGIICFRRYAQERREADIPQGCSDEGPEEAFQYASRKQHRSCHRFPQRRPCRRDSAKGTDSRRRGVEHAKRAHA